MNQFSKIVTRVCLIFITAFCVFESGCSDHAQDSKSHGKTQELLNLTRDDVARALHAGMTTNEIVAFFGKPLVFPMSENRETWMYPLVPFPETNGVDGMFTVGVNIGITNGRLAQWDFSAMTMDRKPAPSASVKLQYKGESIRDASGLKFYIVANEPIAGGRFIDMPHFSKLGFIADSPNLTLNELSGVKIEECSSAPSNTKYWTFMLTLRNEDIPRLKKLTSENIGRKILLLAGDKPIFTGLILVSIGNGAFEFICTEQDQMEMVKSELSTLLKP
jgi:hypothetical protein